MTPDYENKGNVVGVVFFNDGENFEPVGCAGATFDPAASSLLYLDYDEYGEFLESAARDVTSGGPYNSEGTHPDVPVFVAFNLTPGSYDLTVEADGETNDDTIPFMPAGVVVFPASIFRTPEFEENPTGSWCKE
ncbi:hypothetical protein K8I61_09245 [bacterium]|nr:hypothetical protein [bacterium]